MRLVGIYLFLVTNIFICQDGYAQDYLATKFDLKSGLSQMKVSSICEDSLGYIWIGTRNGLNRYDGNEIKKYSIHDGLLSNRILALYVNSNNQLLVLTSKGLSFYNGVTFTHIEKEFEKVDYDMFMLKDELIITEYFSSWKLTDGTFQEIEIDSNLIPYYLIPKNAHFKLIRDTLIYNFQEGKDTLVHEVINDVSRPRTLIRTQNGHIWIGSDNGAVLLKPNYFSTFISEELENIWSMLETESSYYFSSYGSGLFEMNKSNRIIKKVDQQNKLQSFHQGIAKDKNDDLYFCEARTLIKYDGKNFEPLIPWNPSFGIKYDTKRDQLVWGASEGFAIKPIDGKIELVKDTTLIHKNHYIMSVTIDQKGDYWFGSYNGLTHYFPDENKSEMFTKDNSRLPSGESVFTGLSDSKGNLWFGGDKNLMVFNKITNQLDIIESTLLNTQIKAIVEWDEEHLMISTKEEIVIFNHASYLRNGTIKTTFLNESNSYQGYEPGFDGLYIDSNKDVWVLSGAAIDILKVRPNKIKNSQLRLRIEKVNDHFTSTHFLDIKTNDTIFINDLNLASIALNVIGTERPSILKFRYQLDNDEWSGWSEESRFNLQDLSHGTHKLKAQVGPSDVAWDSYFDVVYLKVSLPIYKRSFFLPLIFTCLGLALASLIYFIYKNKQEQERYMQQLEESKYLKSQLLLSEMNPHFIFNVLTSIQNKIIRGDKEAANKKLIQLSALMRNFLSSSYKSNQPKKTFENEITLKREIDLLSSYLEFEQSISNDQFDYSLNYNSEINAEQIMIPPMIIQPYVENAVKHGILPKNEGGTIEVDFILSDEGLTCKIKDDGVGMDMKNSAEGNRKSHKSLGSQLVKERVRLLNSLGYNIEIKTESILGLGTEIHILILDKF